MKDYPKFKDTRGETISFRRLCEYCSFVLRSGRNPLKLTEADVNGWFTNYGQPLSAKTQKAMLEYLKETYIDRVA